MNKYQVKNVISKSIPACSPAPEWIGLTVQGALGIGTVVEAFHNVNDGITIKVDRENGSGYTFTDKVTVI
jgi:hypothetical protein